MPSSNDDVVQEDRDKFEPQDNIMQQDSDDDFKPEDSDDSVPEDSDDFETEDSDDDFFYSLENYLNMFRSDCFDFPVDDYFLMFVFKVRECQNTSHGWRYEWTECPYSHPGEKACRRDPRKYHYSSSPCPDYGKGACGKGDECEFAHGEFECFLHPARYRTQLCEDVQHCHPDHVCFFAHTPEQLRVQPYTRRQTILKLFEEMIQWRRRREENTRDENPFRFNWTHFHLSILRTYLVKFSLSSNFRVLSFANFFEDEFWYLTPGSSVRDAIVTSFARDLQEFFVVPKQHQLFQRDENLKQDEFIAAFINLLLRILQYHGEVSLNSLEVIFKPLKKVLRFLLTVVGDISLAHDEQEQVQNLLAKIEAAANEAGSLLHFVVFSTSYDRIFETMDERLSVLLKHETILIANIIKFSKLPPVITETNITPKMDSVNSIFIVDSLLYDLENLLKQEDDMISDVKDKIKELQQELKLSRSFIKVSQFREMDELKEHYVMRIIEMAYAAEYLINSFLVGDAPSRYFSIRLSLVIHKIKLVETEIQDTKKNHEIVASKVERNFNVLSLKNERSSEVDDIIVGIEDKEKYIQEHLLGEEKHLQIIFIFGMPGLGKTTLVKKLYYHPSVKHHFDRCLWCVVSQTYHKKNLLIDILDSLKTKLDKVEILKMEEEKLMEEIHKSLFRRRYLIVIDDLWSLDAWYDLQSCFPDDQNGSRILFTSRNKDVAPPYSIIYELPPLSDEHCWELLKKKVFQNEDFHGVEKELALIGKRIATKCRGVPLAVVVTAGILSRMDKDRGSWENVEGNLASYIFSDQKKSMMQILELSYKYLPDHLKPCFLYLGAFPEDTQIPVWKLMRLWIAEGFILKKDKKSSESLAEQYLMELIDKSLVMVAKRRLDGGVKACVVHDLLRDLCLKRCKEENFLKYVDENYSIYEKHHRLCARNSEAASPILPFFGLHVRSLFGSLPKTIVFNMKLLRVLDLLNIGDSDNLSEIGLLVHLRYLAIVYMSTVTAPRRLAWIGSLVNLEFVVVEAYNSVFIPSVMLKMKKLRFSKFTRLVYFDEDCNSSQTNNLEFLSCVWITNLKDEEVLKCSPHLRKLKCKCEALWEEEKGEYRYPDFSFFTQLESLSIARLGRFREVNIFNLPFSIKKLTLSYFCWPWENISIIGGLPNLQILKLINYAFEGKIWETRDGEFQQLTFLKLYESDLAQWDVPASEHFPKLRQLVLTECKYLQEIPYEIGEIATLQLIKVEGKCQKSLVESAREIEREQRDYGNEELMVICANIEILDPDSVDTVQSSDEDMDSDDTAQSSDEDIDDRKVFLCWT